MKKFIKDLGVGEKIQSIFLLKNKELLRTKYDKPYLRLVLTDKTGEIEARVWEGAERMDKEIHSGQGVTVWGTVESWQNKIQFKIEGIREALDDEYSREDLIRSVANIEEIFSKVKDCLEGISDKWLLLLAEEFFCDSALMDKFKRSPGAKRWHNAYLGGLLEHTYEVMLIVEKVSSFHPEANRDLALTGAFLHDMGKVQELDPNTFEYTLEGGLIGHLSLSFELLSKKISRIENFPKGLELHLKHIILSHHGEYEQQSPVLPKTLEATIVYHADELVSQANAIDELIQAQSKLVLDSDRGGEQEWSNFVSIKNRKYLLKLPEKEDKTLLAPTGCK